MLHKIRRIGGLLVFTAIVQAGSAVFGFLMTNWLSIEHYALYSIFTIFSGSLAVLVVCGTGLGFSTLVGRFWPDRIRIGSVVAAVSNERSRIALVTIPVTLITAAVALVLNGGTVKTTLWILIALGIVAASDFRTKVVEKILGYSGKEAVPVYADLASVCVRLLLVAVLYSVGLLNIYFATSVVVLVYALRAKYIDRVSRLEFARTSSVLEEDQREIRRQVIRQMPVDVFYCLQPQIVIFLAAAFGGATATASVGALSRIGQIIIPIVTVASLLAMPRFSKLKTGIQRTFFLFIGVFLLALVPILSLPFLFPTEILRLLGPNYSGLEVQLQVYIVGVAGGAFTSFAWSLLANRGLTRFTQLQIPLFIIWIVAASELFDLTTLSGVLWLQAGFFLPQLVAVVFELSSLRKASRQEIQ